MEMTRLPERTNERTNETDRTGPDCEVTVKVYVCVRLWFVFYICLCLKKKKGFSKGFCLCWISRYIYIHAPPSLPPSAQRAKTSRIS